MVDRAHPARRGLAMGVCNARLMGVQFSPVQNHTATPQSGLKNPSTSDDNPLSDLADAHR